MVFPEREISFFIAQGAEILVDALPRRADHAGEVLLAGLSVLATNY